MLSITDVALTSRGCTAIRTVWLEARALRAKASELRRRALLRVAQPITGPDARMSRPIDDQTRKWAPAKRKPASDNAACAQVHRARRCDEAFHRRAEYVLQQTTTVPQSPSGLEDIEVEEFAFAAGQMRALEAGRQTMRRSLVAMQPAMEDVGYTRVHRLCECTSAPEAEMATPTITGGQSCTGINSVEYRAIQIEYESGALGSRTLKFVNAK